MTARSPSDLTSARKSSMVARPHSSAAASRAASSRSCCAERSSSARTAVSRRRRSVRTGPRNVQIATAATAATVTTIAVNCPLDRACVDCGSPVSQSSSRWNWSAIQFRTSA